MVLHGTPFRDVMKYKATDAPDLSGVTNMNRMFDGASSFNGDISAWDVSKVTNMVFMFNGATAFNQPLDSWNVSKVTNMSLMFNGASSFNGNISAWDVSKVTNMSLMFNGATAFNQPLDSWNVSKVTNMSLMFNGASSFNGNISAWDVSKVTSMYSMFNGVSSFNGNISAWDVSKVADMNSMFLGASSFNGDISAWDVSKVTNMFSMFNGASSFNGNISAWDVSKVTNMYSMFNGVSSFNGNISAWDVSKVTSMHSMFNGASSFNGDISAWDVSKVADMYLMFAGASSFDGDISAWDVSSVTRMYSMFNGASSFNGNISAWDVSSVASMYSMFNGASSFNGNISAWDVSKVADMNLMFTDAASFEQNLGNWYVVPDSMSIARTDVPGVVGTISAQSTYLDSHRPAYAIVPGDPARFTIVNGNQLNMTSVGTESDYAVNVTASGGSVFENGNNWSILDVTVTGGVINAAPELNSIGSQSVNELQPLTFTATATDANSGDSLTFSLAGSPPTGATINSTTGVFSWTPTASQTGAHTITVQVEDSAGATDSEAVTVTVTDSIAPTISSIERYSPSSATTDSQTLIYKVTFSEDVTGVDAADFALSSGSTGGTGTSTGTEQFTQTRSPALAITQANTISDTITVPGSGTATSVSVAVNVTHTYIGDLKIDLIAPDGTTKTVHNRSGGSNDDIDQTYAPDFGGESIAGTWTLRINDNYASADDGTLNSWTLTINHGSSTTASPVTSISGSGDTYYATVSATTDGTYNLDLISSGHGIADESSNPLTSTTPTGSDETYTVSTITTDTTAPTVSSIERYSPSSATTDSQTLIYKVTFSEDVTGVDAADFALSSGSTGGTGTGTEQFTQTRSPALAITQANTISDTITVPGSGTATSVSVAVNVTHTYIGDLKIDLIAPDGTTKTVHNRSGGSNDDIDQTYAPDFGGESIAGTWTLRINDNYASADDGTLNSWTLTINHGSSTTASPVTSISGSGDTYYATVSATTDGTYNLDLISSGHGIADESSNPLTSTTPTGSDETYTVSTITTDTTAPTVSSIERYSPSSATTDSQTLIYKVTFSEDVTGVDAADFALSSGSTGGTGTSTGTEQFTQTRSPALAITQANTISDTITVPGSGTATSVSVAVNVTHTYIGDLKIDLIAPDGTTKTVHNRSGGSNDDIDQTYAPDFGGESIAGTWTLRINDNYASADDGTLNSWTLTINHGSSTTASPVTSISGSGDTYYATVSATTDGTYNLDLISSGHGIADESSNPLTSTTPTGSDETYTVSTITTDTTAPTVSSIERYSPSSATTDSQTLIYKVTFSEDVTGVDAADFALSSGSTGGTSTGTEQFTQTRSPALAITQANTISDTITVPGSGTATSVSVAVNVTHTYIGDLKIDLIAPDGTTKTVHNRSGGSNDDIDQTYAPDFGGESIAGTWTLRINDNYASADDGTLNSWTLTINHGSSTTASPVTSISGSGDTYYATVSATTDGTYNLDLISSGHGIADESSNPLTSTTPTGSDETYTVSTITTDTTAPTVSSIERYSPSSATTDSQTLIYKVTFSEDVTGVDAADFALSSGSTGGTGTSTGTEQFTQTRSPALAITQANTISDTITVPGSGTATSVSVAVNVTHTYIGDLKIDLIAPDGTTKTVHNRSGGSNDDIDQTYAPDFGGESIAGTWTLRINDNYASADDGTLNSWTLTINHGSSTTASPVTSISGSGDTYYATVSATTDGTYNLDLISSGHGIADESSNPLTSTTPTGSDETYTVSTITTDTTAPTVSSIERYSPSSATTDSQTLIYKVTFSEDVTGVDAADFALSSGSTGGTGTSTGTEQFTQTRSPALAITQANTISDTITVPGSGTATSVSVAVNVTHTYIGDLKIDLIAPDGTTKTVHNRSGGSNDDIDQTYAPDFGGESIAGTWTLRINDNYASADDGTLNSWTLTINHGSSTTASPVTSISGSGDTYYATVSATTDGTYNLDLISSGHGIADESSNPLTSTTPTGSDETYTVSTPN